MDGAIKWLEDQNKKSGVPALTTAQVSPKHSGSGPKPA
jgi:hypothetical protein